MCPSSCGTRGVTSLWRTGTGSSGACTWKAGGEEEGPGSLALAEGSRPGPVLTAGPHAAWSLLQVRGEAEA